MQKTEKAPKRAESQNKETVLEKGPVQVVSIYSTEDFRNQLLNLTQQHLVIAQNIQHTHTIETLSPHCSGLQFCFEKLKPESEQLISIAQGTLAHLDKTQSELSIDSQVRNEPVYVMELENSQQILLALHEWLSQYQSQTELSKQYQLQQQAPHAYNVPASGSGMPNGATKTLNAQPSKQKRSSHAAATTIYVSNTLQELINALNVTTVNAFVIALQNLNQFLSENPTIPIPLQQFFGLFDQLDQTMQVLPESYAPGLTQRQIIAGMVSVNVQTTQLYGLLIGLQII